MPDTAADYLAELTQRLRGIGDQPIKVESSIATPEGLLITCPDTENAQRMHKLILAYLPPEAHYLIELADRRVLCKWLPGQAPKLQ